MLYELISAHLLPFLHAECENAHSATEGRVADPLGNLSEPSDSQLHHHALLTSHHLISPQKRRSLQQWSSSLHVKGFAKVGYPGIIYAEGTRENVEEFVGNVKAMQWLALRVRFVEFISQSEPGKDNTKGTWTEFEKVGEVVEEMRRIGKEEYVLHMGIGSVGK
ncbi:hypothetical protein HWV62_1761 [Athelia sp. TMB]|nr:hypothetical protein HWV62_1761 [Athelia sp. TMB]